MELLLSDFGKSMETALMHAGLEPGSLDQESLFRALLLHRYGLPLSRAVITGTPGEQSLKDGGISDLLRMAGEILSEGGLKREERRNVENLVKNLRDYVSQSVPGKEFGSLLIDSLLGWSSETENEILALLSGSDLEKRGELIHAFRNLVVLLTDRIRLMEFDGAGSIHLLKQAISEMVDSLSALPELRADFSLQGQAASMLAELLEKQSARLRSLLFVDTGDTADDLWFEQVFKPAAQVYRSGQFFEWRLLAWYRAGADPYRLRELVRQDLKGMLLAFTGRTGRESAMGTLCRRAGDIQNTITSNQIANLPCRPGADRDAYLEFPFFGTTRNEPVLVQVSKRSKRRERKSDEIACSFSVETSNLGTVKIAMRLQRRVMKLSFDIEREEMTDPANRMAGELRNRLRECGFTAGEIVVNRKHKASVDPGEES